MILIISFWINASASVTRPNLLQLLGTLLELLDKFPSCLLCLWLSRCLFLSFLHGLVRRGAAMKAICTFSSAILHEKRKRSAERLPKAWMKACFRKLRVGDPDRVNDRAARSDEANQQARAPVGVAAAALVQFVMFRYNRMNEELHEDEALVNPLAQGAGAAVSLTFLSKIHKPMSRRITDNSWCKTFLFARYGVAFM